MTITYQQLQDNYYFWVLTYICNVATPIVTDFVAASRTYTIARNETGNIYIDTWTNTDCTQPSDDDMMLMFSTDQYIPYKNSLQIQQISSSLALKTTTTADMPALEQNTAIYPYVMIYNMDTDSVMIKTSETEWNVMWTKPESKLGLPKTAIFGKLNTLLDTAKTVAHQSTFTEHKKSEPIEIPSKTRKESLSADDEYDLI